MVFALCTYTTLIVTINIVADKSTNLFPPSYDISSLTPTDVEQRRYGSKLVLVVEQCQCLTSKIIAFSPQFVWLTGLVAWSVKACLIIMFARLTVGRREHIALKVLAAYVAFGFIFMEVFYLGVWCRPFHSWSSPTSPGPRGVFCD